MPKITPFLWFDGTAEQAARFYLTVFKPSKILTVRRSGTSEPGRKGPVMLVAFRILNQSFTALNGGPRFQLTPAISFVVRCKTQREIDRYWRKLTEGGVPGPCGWLRDKFGVSWQIIPEALPRLLRSDAAMHLMKGMSKLDLKALRAAARKRPAAYRNP